MGIWAASVRRWMADVVAGHGREDAYLETPGQSIESLGLDGMPWGNLGSSNGTTGGQTPDDQEVR